MRLTCDVHTLTNLPLKTFGITDENVQEVNKIISNILCGRRNDLRD